MIKILRKIGQKKKDCWKKIGGKKSKIGSPLPISGFTPSLNSTPLVHVTWVLGNLVIIFWCGRLVSKS